MTILPDFEQQLVDLAARTYGANSRPRKSSFLGGTSRVFVRFVVPASAALVTVAIAVAALLFLHPAHHHPQPASTADTEASLLAQYAVLRRPQTLEDRREAGPAPRLGGTFGFSGGSGVEPGPGFGPGPGPGHETKHYTVRITGLAHYEDVRALTRVVTVDGLRVSLFVERLIRSHTPPKATVTGNDRQAAAGRVTPKALAAVERRENAGPSFIMLARTTRSGHGQLIAPTERNGARALPKRVAARIAGLYAVSTASLPGPDGEIVAIVPDGVARIGWRWPREFNSQKLAFVPRVTLSAPVDSNVAVATAPARFTEAEQIGPETVVRYAADGSVIASFTDSSNSAENYQNQTWDPSDPAPATPLSRQAEHDPSTPNRIVLLPSTATLRSLTLGPDPQIFFNVLLNHATYFLRLTGGPRSGCLQQRRNGQPESSYGEVLNPPSEADVRGDTFEDNVPFGVITCRGTYRLSVSVLNAHGKPYPPFGSANFAVR
jgi:hypothetical protein